MLGQGTYVCAFTHFVRSRYLCLRVYRIAELITETKPEIGSVTTTNQSRDFLFVLLDISNFKVSLTVDLILANPFQIFIPSVHSFFHILLFAVSFDEKI